MITQTYSHSDIVVIRFPFSNLSQQKARPALIISPQSYTEKFSEVLVMQITSRNSSFRPQYGIIKWQEAGLKVPSFVRIANIHHIQTSHIAGKIGKLHISEYQMVMKLLEQFVSNS